MPTAVTIPTPPALRPICVDLDGTLIQTDILVESLLLACRSWTTFRSIPRLLVRGKAAFKAGLAESCAPPCALLPYDTVLIDFLKQRKTTGIELLLVTASNSSIAVRINEHLDFLFDDVLASDEHHNLRGDNKARLLVERFGERGFTYIGNDAADLRVWCRAGGAMIVGASARVIRRARKTAPVEHVFDHRGLNRPPWMLLSAGLLTLALSRATYAFERAISSFAGKSSP
jgi:phosphoserine phosphatase